ncbi:putative polysaccharide export protein [Megalodesulfovibrio gigas DSM 1382 = ATCC 19364]|uniref:Putative polysaccharide export protein n=2 Tax=Megalodesulfovibrio gigas TaxID=879 RepID=T2GEY6_MEGG1|nr:putative polysaccharide export protein [Megalodesulfovibrio gigas DSM 1382 = ATCC 19364]
MGAINLQPGAIMTLYLRPVLLLALFWIAALLCPGCGGPKDPVSLSPVSAGSSINATRNAVHAGPLAYGDKLSVHVWRHDDLTLEPQVDETGGFDFPLIGKVQASGKTIGQLRDEMRSRLAVYLVNPQLMVELMQSAFRTAYVYGEVTAEGPVVLNHDVTLWEAISRCGGFTRDASEGNVLIIRGAQGRGEMQLLVADMKLANVEKDKPFNFSGYLAPGDLVFVPPTTLANVERFMTRLRNILEAIASAERAIIFIPQVRDALIDVYDGQPPDYTSSSGNLNNVAGENLSNQGGVITPTQ